MFGNNSFATVWEVDKKDKFSSVSLSTSSKAKDSQEYETDFSSKYVTFVGEAQKKIDLIDLSGVKFVRIKLLSTGVKNRYDKEKGREFTNFYVFDFELFGDNKNSAGCSASEAPKKDKKSASKKSFKVEEVEEEAETDDDLPF